MLKLSGNQNLSQEMIKKKTEICSSENKNI